jgi:hypothetical protein
MTTYYKHQTHISNVDTDFVSSLQKCFFSFIAQTDLLIVPMTYCLVYDLKQWHSSDDDEF